MKENTFCPYLVLGLIASAFFLAIALNNGSVIITDLRTECLSTVALNSTVAVLNSPTALATKPDHILVCTDFYIAQGGEEDPFYEVVDPSRKECQPGEVSATFTIAYEDSKATFAPPIVTYPRGWLTIWSD